MVKELQKLGTGHATKKKEGFIVRTPHDGAEILASKAPPAGAVRLGMTEREG